MKCDEEKPACYQCRKTGRVCDGYALAKDKTVTQARLVPEAFRIPNLAIARLDHRLPGSNQERRCFDLFECEMGKEIMRAFNTTHTHQLILQAGHSNGAIKHAVVALGSLGEHLIQRKVLLVQAARGDGTLKFARLQYLKAIRQLQSAISSSQVESLELILVCCLLLTIFDFLCGEDSMAQIHLNAGLNIIHRCYSPAVRDRMRQQASDVEKSHPLVYDLFRIFSVMDLHGAIWLGLSSFHSPPLIPPQTIMPTFPPISINLTLDKISTLLNYHLVRAHCFRHSVAINESNLNTYIAPFHIRAEKQRLLYELHQWPSMLEQFLLSRTDPPTEAMARRVSLMRMNYFSTLVGLSTFLQTTSPPTETLTASTTSSFSQILTEAQHLLHPASPANRAALLLAVGANAGELDASGIPLFAFVPGAIQPLYLTAVKCHNRATCEAAVSMLEEAQWREGAWNSSVMARIARRCLREKFELGS